MIAAWIGHKGASLTMRLYTHSQDQALIADVLELLATDPRVGV
ncbi:recombinase XerD [Mycolicibacterium hodleri]|uniref:Recombinase XerD n=1 Tax=Mycolicibacterium hodleri TaxID=49897 RepID=A0A502DV71_9MYCO|nr:recombinase XerD [Mycolicibacterium hodleri]TPG28211.1 recombinase XerD [Mycolicibacterium hodleri]